MLETPELDGGIGFRHREPSNAASASEKVELSPDFWATVNKASLSEREIAIHRWHEAFRRVLDHRLKKNSSEDPLIDHERHIRRLVPGLHASKLLRMAITEELGVELAHKALVRFMQFSPDGRFLVTSRCVVKAF